MATTVTTTPAKDDYEFDPRIDQNRLDWEWLRQAPMYHRAARKAADARKRVTEARATLDVVRAECASAIRNDPVKFDIGKLTESALAEAVLQQLEYKEAQQELVDAQHAADIAAAAVNSLDQKRRALADLVELHGRDYFSEPRARSPEAQAKMGTTAKAATRRRGQREVDEDADE